MTMKWTSLVHCIIVMIAVNYVISSPFEKPVSSHSNFRRNVRDISAMKVPDKCIDASSTVRSKRISTKLLSRSLYRKLKVKAMRDDLIPSLSSTVTRFYRGLGLFLGRRRRSLAAKLSHIYDQRQVKCLNPVDIANSGSSPLLVFVNKKSGGKQGAAVLKAVESVFSDVQICDLSTKRPSEFLRVYADCGHLIRVLCCGGDGTVSWVLKELRAHNLSEVPVGVVPIGTGNDLARTLQTSFFPPGVTMVSGEDICADPTSALLRYSDPGSCAIDIWNVSIDPLLPPSHDPMKAAASRWKRTRRRYYADKLMVNYFSVGVDGAVSMAFDRMREWGPGLFFSQVVNKAWYGLLGLRIYLFRRKVDLSRTESVEMWCDGKRVHIPPGTEGIVVLNVDSYAGGSRVWESQSEDQWTPSTPSDGTLEVVALFGVIHLGVIKTGLSRGTKIAQGHTLRIHSNSSLPMQCDGEPWLQRPADITISRQGSATFMVPSANLRDDAS